MPPMARGMTSESISPVRRFLNRIELTRPPVVSAANASRSSPELTSHALIRNVAVLIEAMRPHRRHRWSERRRGGGGRRRLGENDAGEKRGQQRQRPDSCGHRRPQYEWESVLELTPARPP